jgi:phosphinothricin acetyltransferase
VSEPVLRRARSGDLEALTGIYNHYVRETPITFDLEPNALEQRRKWLEDFDESGRHQIFVAERDGTLLGYACSRRFRERAAYDPSVETSVYLAVGEGGRGLGARLYQELFDALRDCDAHRAIAGITLPNPASVALHERFGFERVGVLHEVGYKLGRYWDVLWMEKPLG